MLVLVFDPLAILLVIAANMQLNMATGKRIEFMSLDETVTETPVEEFVEELDDVPEETVEDKTVETDEAFEDAMDKISAGESLNPVDRKSIKSNLQWLIDKKRK